MLYNKCFLCPYIDNNKPCINGKCTVTASFLLGFPEKTGQDQAKQNERGA